MTGKVGVAISTYKRPEVLSQALGHWAMAMPDELVVNHDRNGIGIAVTKNRGLAALMAAGCEHLFLADSDVWPVITDPFRHYVADPLPHLCHCWGHTRFHHRTDDGRYTVWSWPRGVLLYVERRVVERVGGMRLEFGRWGGEHAEWSRRIHNAGFTPFPYMDLAAVKRGVWYATDYDRSVPSTFSPKDKEANTAKRHELYNRYRHSDEYVEYRACTLAV